MAVTKPFWLAANRRQFQFMTTAGPERHPAEFRSPVITLAVWRPNKPLEPPGLICTLLAGSIPIFSARIWDTRAQRNSASSIYHGLQLSARKTVGALQLSASYTYSHSIDDASSAGDASFVNSYDLAANRASSNFDQRHVFTLSYIYDLPFFKGSGLTHSLLGGWQ